MPRRTNRATGTRPPRDFSSLLRYGLADARLEYNLANAEYKRGRLGEAILHYERARRLAPADPTSRRTWRSRAPRSATSSRTKTPRASLHAVAACRTGWACPRRPGCSSPASGSWRRSSRGAGRGRRIHARLGAGRSRERSLATLARAPVSGARAGARLEGTPRAVDLEALGRSVGRVQASTTRRCSRCTKGSR